MGPPPVPGRSIEELIRQARAGEEGSLEELIRRYQRKMGMWAEERGCLERPGGVRPSDISQEAALLVYQRFISFKGSSKGEWDGWLRSIVLHQAEQMLRKEGSQKRSAVATVPLDADEALEVRAAQPSPSQHTAHNEERRLVWTKLFSLKGDQGEAVRLYFIEGLTKAEVAKQLGRSTIAAVDSLLQRGVAGLKESASGETSSATEAAFRIFLRKCEAGEDVDPKAFVASYPHCADELREMLRWVERLKALKRTGSSSKPKG
ncbi:sigma-70 family RNA polymerase sigma factor [Hyalangium gracile]|uniref:sigma-70 family RNA polymerase sigma factor n=1 Tax=Hyalangium gracile TaxID=394092 RepID=UPI001CCADC07|nr:sigma-70 family RNA polymerase sigma factor [Hyalangium gracile]